MKRRIQPVLKLETSGALFPKKGFVWLFDWKLAVCAGKTVGNFALSWQIPERLNPRDGLAASYCDQPGASSRFDSAIAEINRLHQVAEKPAPTSPTVKANSTF